MNEIQGFAARIEQERDVMRCSGCTRAYSRTRCLPACVRLGLVFRFCRGKTAAENGGS